MLHCRGYGRKEIQENSTGSAGFPPREPRIHRSSAMTPILLPLRAGKPDSFFSYDVPNSLKKSGLSALLRVQSRISVLQIREGAGHVHPSPHLRYGCREFANRSVKRYRAGQFQLICVSNAGGTSFSIRTENHPDRQKSDSLLTKGRSAVRHNCGYWGTQCR